MSAPKLRNYALIATLLATLFFLLQTFNLGSSSSSSPSPAELSRTTRNSIKKHLGQYAPAAVAPSTSGPSSRILKASALFGENNHFYEEALASHKVHNELHGYDMRVLRDRITNGYSTKAAYMLSLVVNELTKPKEEQAEWIAWTGPDLILLNPHIPLELFLPPADFDNIHFLGTHDGEGLNLGVYFMRVHQWSARLLIDVLSYPPDWLGDAAEKDEVAFEMVVSSDGFREHVQYQPRQWYNPYQLSATDTEAKKGDLMVHFHDLEGDKWNAMARTLSNIAKPGNEWEIPLQGTKYEKEVKAYWQRLRASRELVKQADPFLDDENTRDLVKRLQYATTYEADDFASMDGALHALSLALGVPVPT